MIWDRGMIWDRPGSIPGLSESEHTDTLDRYGERDLCDASWVAAALDNYLEDGVDPDNEIQIGRIMRLRNHFEQLAKNFYA